MSLIVSSLELDGRGRLSFVESVAIMVSLSLERLFVIVAVSLNMARRKLVVKGSLMQGKRVS